MELITSDTSKPNDFKCIANKDELLNSLLCKICNSWPMNSLLCKDCNVLYCQKCAKDKNENKINPLCLICENKPILINPPQQIMTIINKAKFECKYCKEIQTCTEIIKHANYCLKNPSRRTICQKCTIEVSLDQLNTHNCVEELLTEIKRNNIKLEEYDKLTSFNYNEYIKLKNTLK
jgi:hypothetical protein